MTKKKIRLLLWGLILVSGIAMLLFQIAVKSAKAEEELLLAHKTPTALPVEVLEIVPTNWEQWKSYYGQAKSTKTQDVTSYVREIVEAVHVDAGDRVSKGQRLVTLNKEDYTVGAQASSAAYEEAKLNHARLAELSKKGGVAQSEVDKAYAVMKAEGANLQNARSTLKRTEIVAKTSGIITARNVEPGEIAEPGQSLLTIEDPNEMEARLMVSAGDVGKIKEGASVRIATPQGTFQGRVKRVTPRAQDGSGLYPVLVALDPKSGILPGTYIEGSFLLQKKSDAVVIPSSAVIHRGDRQYVYTIAGDSDCIASLTEVTTSSGNKDSIVVSSGLSVGDLVVISGSRGLSDGISVTYDALNKDEEAQS